MGGFILSLSLRLGPIVDGEVWPREPGVAGYIIWELGSREMHASVQVPVFFPLFIQTEPINDAAHS